MGSSFSLTVSTLHLEFREPLFSSQVGMYNKGRASWLPGITGSPQSSIFAMQNQNPALVIYSLQRKRSF